MKVLLMNDSYPIEEFWINCQASFIELVPEDEWIQEFLKSDLIRNALCSVYQVMRGRFYSLKTFLSIS